jgi:hypothetical protein
MNNYITLLINYTTSEENQIASLVDVYNGDILDYYETESKVCNIMFNSYTLFEKIESELDSIRNNNSKVRYILFSINNKNQKYRIHINKKGKKIITKNPVRIIGL